MWDEMADGWEAGSEDTWADSRSVGAWLTHTPDPQSGDTVLELGEGVGDTGFASSRRPSAPRRVIITDFTPEMVAAARRAAELGITKVAFRVLNAERMDLATDSVDGVLCSVGLNSSSVATSTPISTPTSCGSRSSWRSAGTRSTHPPSIGGPVATLERMRGPGAVSRFPIP